MKDVQWMVVDFYTLASHMVSGILKKHRITGFLPLFVVMLSFFLILPATSVSAKTNPKYASIVMDADTGMIISRRYADKTLHPASLTKVMTLLLTFEALEQGRIGLKDRVYISRHAAGMVPSKLGLPAGSSIRVKDAIYALITKSANDVAVALAEHIAGTEKGFARQMTRRARLIGMSRTTFRNASGLHDKRQVSTARDMAKLARVVIGEYPGFYKYFSTRTFRYRGKTYRNHNKLLGQYQGMDGMKTGYINASGFNLMASAVRNNRRIIGVVFGGKTSKRRNNHMRVLLDRGFNKLHDIRVAHARVPLPHRKPGPVTSRLAMAPGDSSQAHANGFIPATDVAARMKPSAQNWAALNMALKNEQFSGMVEQGGFDPAISDRLETGLIAISAHKGRAEGIRRVMNTPPVKTAQPWSVQVGAFSDRAQTSKAVYQALNALPYHLKRAQPAVAPLKTSKGWIFRARLNGYTKTEAQEACRVLRKCMTVAPVSY